MFKGAGRVIALTWRVDDGGGWASGSGSIVLVKKKKASIFESNLAAFKYSFASFKGSCSKHL